MKILVLGGTRFVGRHITQHLLDQGHQVSLFNRGRTNPDLFPHAEKLVGDRAGQLDALRGKTWDTVVDVNGYVPRHVRESAELLRPRVGQHVYISTGAVYRQPFATDGDESHPTVDTTAADDLEDPGKYYAELQLLSEQAAQEIYGADALVLRIGLQFGPYDDTDRASYWIWRVLQGGPMLAPGHPGDAFQTIDPRDQATFIELAIREHLNGIYNVTGRSITWGQWLETIQQVTGQRVDLTWIADQDFLQELAPEGRGLFTAYPLFIPQAWGDWWRNNTAKAEAAGLRYRPYAETIQAILDWRPNLRNEAMTVGPTLAQEAEILEAWNPSQA